MLEQCEQNSTGGVFQAFPPCVHLVFLECVCLEKEAVNSATLLSWVVSPFLDPVLVKIK